MRMKDKVALITGGGRAWAPAWRASSPARAPRSFVADMLERGRSGSPPRSRRRQRRGDLSEARRQQRGRMAGRDREATLAAYGKLDILVNDAGISGSAVDDLFDTAAWERIMAVNATGTFLGMKFAIPPMKQAARRLDRQHLVDLRGHRAARHSCRVQRLEGCGAHADQGGRRAARARQHPRQLGASRADAADAHLRPHRRPGGARQTLEGVPLGRAGRGRRSRERGAVPGVGRGVLHHRGRALRRWRLDRRLGPPPHRPTRYGRPDPPVAPVLFWGNLLEKVAMRSRYADGRRERYAAGRRYSRHDFPIDRSRIFPKLPRNWAGADNEEREGIVEGPRGHHQERSRRQSAHRAGRDRRRRRCRRPRRPTVAAGPRQPGPDRRRDRST